MKQYLLGMMLVFLLFGCASKPRESVPFTNGNVLWSHVDTYEEESDDEEFDQLVEDLYWLEREREEREDRYWAKTGRFYRY